MKEKTTLQKYYYYKDVLDEIAEYPLSKKLTIKDLELSRGIIQAAYKEMYKIDFEETIIDYLCWISTLYIFEKAKEESKIKKVDTFFKYIIDNYSKSKDFRNLLRLFSKNMTGGFLIMKWMQNNFDYEINSEEMRAGISRLFNNWVIIIDKEILDNKSKQIN